MIRRRGCRDGGGRGALRVDGEAVGLRGGIRRWRRRCRRSSAWTRAGGGGCRSWQFSMIDWTVLWHLSCGAVKVDQSVASCSLVVCWFYPDVSGIFLV